MVIMKRKFHLYYQIVDNNIIWSTSWLQNMHWAVCMIRRKKQKLISLSLHYQVCRSELSVLSLHHWAYRFNCLSPVCTTRSAGLNFLSWICTTRCGMSVLSLHHPVVLEMFQGWCGMTLANLQPICQVMSDKISGALAPLWYSVMLFSNYYAVTF